MNYYTYGGNLRDRNKFTSTANTTFGVKRYFSSLDSEIYFGDVQIDEMVHIDFSINEPKLPIYGYNSFYANRIIAGRRTIQGTFAINFTHTNYLIDLLDKIDDSILKSKYESTVYRCEGDDSTGLGIGNSSLFRKQFDITISYGYGKTEGMQTYNSCYQTLVGVQIVDYRQALDTEGNPILDMYSFIAKDMRYNVEGATNEETTEEQPKYDVYSEAPDPLVANTYITEDKNTVETACKNNPNQPGFLVTPTFNIKGDQFSTSIKIDALNNNTDTFKDCILTIHAEENDKGLPLSIGDFKVSTNQDIPLEGSSRDVATKIYKKYQEDKNYTPSITVEFNATINDSSIPVKITTPLMIVQQA